MDISVQRRSRLRHALLVLLMVAVSLSLTAAGCGAGVKAKKANAAPNLETVSGSLQLSQVGSCPVVNSDKGKLVLDPGFTGAHLDEHGLHVGHGEKTRIAATVGHKLTVTGTIGTLTNDDCRVPGNKSIKVSSFTPAKVTIKVKSWSAKKGCSWLVSYTGPNGSSGEFVFYELRFEDPYKVEKLPGVNKRALTKGGPVKKGGSVIALTSLTGKATAHKSQSETCGKGKKGVIEVSSVN